MYEMELTKRVMKFIDSLNSKEKINIAKALEKLCENPFRNDLNIKKLKGYKGVYRLRVDNYRLLYRVKKDVLIIFIFNANYRKDIYRRL